MKTIKICGTCGKPLAPDTLLGLCPQCMMKAGASPTAGEKLPALAAPLPGAIFGGYRIIRLLGEGGMGAAYEAEDLENGRRVALKVLRHAPDSPTARQRFLREGRLAASVNHPNTVYIFGSEEIEGAPVITMEYVSGGTLQERVKNQGPMPVSEAVDAILQIIAGLEAAGEKGVLHRDVKPSNCFVEADGTVKVGDFGLSISTRARDQTALTMAGSIMGTPEYASPEQLRGDELDTRSDIYSVGVTLYFLLTGRTPFHAENMVSLIATVLDKPAPPLRSIRREIPKGVEQIVLRCLAKQPQQRFKNYEQLRAALLSFCSTAPTPATLGMRTVAGALDTFFWMFVEYFWMLLPFYPRNLTGSTGVNPVSVALTVLCYAVFEGYWGVSFGKWICRLRVVGPDRNYPGFLRALARAFICMVVPSLPLAFFGSADFDPGHPLLSAALLSLYFLIFLLLFVTARRHNGFAALHDLLSGTRVIELAAYERRQKLTATEDSAPHTTDAPTIGSFHVLDSLARDGRSEILLGYDTRLLRKVWIRKQPPGTAPVPPVQRDLSRKGRQHWLASRRSETECWDVYEALTGQPLINLLDKPQPWRSVRFWLLDLAEEIESARLDGSSPDTLELNRVWITAEGRAKLLDFPAPGASAVVTPVSHNPAAETVAPPFLTAPQQFLNQVANAALSGRGLPTEIHADTPPVPLPVSAREFLKNLPACPDVQTALIQLRALLDKRAALTRARRLALLSYAPLLLLVYFSTIWFGQVKQRGDERAAPGVGPLHGCLSYLQEFPTTDNGTSTNVQYNAMQVYVVGRFRPLITNDTFWSNKVVQLNISTAQRQLAARALADHPAPSAKEISEAKELVLPKPVVATPWLDMSDTAASGLASIAFYSLLCVLLFRRGPMFRALGIELVTKQGLPAGRWKIFVRCMVTWLPLLALCNSYLPKIFWPLVPLVWLVYLGGAVYAVLHPERGIQDRLAKTWLVPE